MRLSVHMQRARPMYHHANTQLVVLGKAVCSSADCAMHATMRTAATGLFINSAQLRTVQSSW